MKRLILAAVVVGLVNAAPARAQFHGHFHHPGFHGGFGYGGLGYGGGFGGLGYGGFGYGSGFGFSYHRHGLWLGGFSSGYYGRSVFWGPGYRWSVWAPWSPVFPAIAPLTPFGWGPGFLRPGWGVGPGWGWNPAWGGIPWGPNWGPWAGPGVFGVPPFALAGNDPVDPDAGAVANAAGVPPRTSANDDPFPRGNKDDYLVIRPKKDFPPPGQITPAVTQVAAVVRPQPPAFRFDPFANRQPVNHDKADPDPVKESARLVKLGRAAFAAGEYGRAGEHFDRASAADPKAAGPHFLKAQAAFATGGYADAVAAVRSGLDLDPAWPAGTFDPKEPYGANAAAFTAHLADLRKAVAADPDQPALTFLLGYELWFVGEKAEAKKWFEVAEKRLPAPGPIALFK